MWNVLDVVLLTTMAGAAMPIGALLASVERVGSQWLEQELRHSIIAFGGGILLSAVALVLVPEGVKGLSMPVVAVMMLGGGAAFCGLDILIAHAKTSAAQLMAMLSDFLPEALALGALFASGARLGGLLALLIALQNLPEGFNAYRELCATGKTSGLKIVVLFACLVPLGPLAGLIGLYWLAPYPRAISAVMLFAAGGILYLTFQDIAPQARLERHWAPPLGAVAGFLLGLLGQLILTPA